MLNPRSTQRLFMAAQARRIRDLERQLAEQERKLAGQDALLHLLLYQVPKAAPAQPKRKPPKAEMRTLSMQKVAACRLTHPRWTMAEVAKHVGLSVRYCRELLAEWRAATNRHEAPDGLR